MVSLQKLWAVAEGAAARTGQEPEHVFGDIGLFLERDLQNYEYDLTPLNSVAFASTSGDGVHYNFLGLENEATDDAPVIMTVPCAWADRANVIVGENLYEFLCLGCQYGYFSLEQLVYQPEETLLALKNPLPGDGSEQQLLALLTNELSLRPWRDVEERLKELNDRYHPLLKMGAIT
ncbi:MAG: hypothetical protein EOP06_20450 [Proteobacteria bacterium]|nr:MAG: hypothetical protein EOP06_20450 [Pseudomonadota bacterium]